MTTEALDRDIWIPFVSAYPVLDLDLISSVYSASAIHAGGRDRSAVSIDEHLAAFRDFFDYARGQGDAFDIVFHFAERVIGDGVASEHGVFRITAKLASGEGRTSYGRFHVFSRLEDGRWRILTDYDSPGATEEEFDALRP